MVLDTFGPRDWWSAWYELYSPSGYFTAPLTATQHITFSPGNFLVFHAQLNAVKASNWTWNTRFVIAFTDPWSHGGSNAIIDYGASVSAHLYSDHCSITTEGWKTAGPYFRFLFRAADQEADVGDSASGDPCGVASIVDVDYSWAGRSPAERAPWKELGFDTSWGYSHYAWGIISGSVAISLSYGYVPPPPPPQTPTPTPSPTPTPEPCWVCVPPGPPPIWWGFDLSPPECFVLLPSFGWEEKSIFGIHIPGLQIPEVQVCVRWLSVEGEFLGLSFEMLFAGIAALSAIAILLSILGGI